MTDRATKLRIRAVSSTGKPVANIRVELFDGTPTDGKARSAGGQVLASLNTSRDGFSIFSLDRLRERLRGLTSLWIRFAGRDDMVFPIDARVWGERSAYVPFTLPAVDVALEAEQLLPWLDDGVDPDDVTAIPGTFPDFGDLEFGDDYCGRLIPNDRTVRVFEHNYVVRTDRDVLTGVQVGVRAGAGKGPGGVSHVAFEYDAQGKIHIDGGELANFQIRWLRLGYTFGDLLYSLPLAPCESVNLAISHWEQGQSARAEQTSTTDEARTSTASNRGAVAESMSALSDQRHFGWAVSAGNSSGSGASGSGVVYGMLLKAKAAFQTTVGATASGSHDRASFASNATRDISSTIQQAAEAWRRDHQVVVMEQNETEDQQVSTRTVCNNNHCHVLNIFYHEVLCNHRVSTRMMGHREVYLVPYRLLTFDRATARCLKPLLSPFLLDQDLLACSDEPPAGPAAPPAPKTTNKFRIEMTIGMVRKNPWQLLLRIVGRIGGPRDFAVTRSDTWGNGYTYQYDVDTADFLPEDLRQVGLFLQGPPGNVFSGMPTIALSSYKISMLDPLTGQWTQIASGSLPLTPFSANPMSVVSMSGGAGDSGEPDPEAGDCLDRLVAHLNCNSYYYNSLVWLLEDPNERIDRLDRVVCGGDRLLDLVLPEPVAVMGHYVAFARSDSDYIPYDEQPVIEDRLVVVPTPGIFADAALGHCTTCETPDDTKYWDWSKTPCSCCGTAPTLTAPAASSLLGNAAGTFPGYPTTNLTNVVSPGEGGANSLVAALGSTLVSAMLSGKGAAEELGQLKDLLGKLTDALKDMAPDPGEGPKPAEKVEDQSGATPTTGGSTGPG